MTLENYLSSHQLNDLYDKTKDMFKNAWTIISSNEAYYPFIQIDLLQLFNPIQNLDDKLKSLSTIQNAHIKLQTYKNVTYAFLNATQNPVIFTYDNLLPIFDQTDPNILKIYNWSEEILTKLSNTLMNKKIDESKISKLILNLYNPNTNTICAKFLTFLSNLTPQEFAKHIIFYTAQDGYLLHVLENNFELPDDYYLRFTIHHSLNSDIQEPAQFLMDALYLKQWKKPVIDTLFNAFNTDILNTLDQLKLIEFGHPYYENIILGLLNLIYVDQLNGYKKITLLLSIFVNSNQKFSPFLNQLKYFSQNEMNLIFMKLSQGLIAPKNFLSLPEGISVLILKNLIDPKENLFWVLENTNAFLLFFSQTGEIYLDLMNELKVLGVETIKSWLEIFIKNPAFYDDLKPLSKTDKRAVGFPNLIAGILSIGDIEEPSVTPNFVNAQNFLNSLFIHIGPDKMLKNIGNAIDVLGSKIKAKKFVTFIKDKTILIDNIAFEDDVDLGIDKSTCMVAALCPSETKIMTKISKNFLNLSTSKDLINQLFYKDDQNQYQVVSGFLQAIEQNSLTDNVVTDIQSFCCKESQDPFLFVRMLERMSGTAAAFDKFNTWLKDSIQDREALIAKMCSLGSDQLESFVSKFASDTKVGDLFQELDSIKGKSQKLYDGLIAIASTVPTDDFQEIQPLIQKRLESITNNSDVLGVLNSSHIDYDQAKSFITNLSPELIEAIHDAFDGDDDIDQTLKFVLSVIDKDFVLAALSKLTKIEAKFLIQAFARNELFMQKALQTINDLGYDGGIQQVKILIKEFITFTEAPKKEKRGIAPFPVKVCENFMDASADLTDKDLWESLAIPGLIKIFNDALETAKNKKIVRELLRDKTFMFTLSCIDQKAKLIQSLCTMYQTNDDVYLNEVYTAHFVLYDILSDKVMENLFYDLDQNNDLRKILDEYKDDYLDTSCKFLTCVIKSFYSNGYDDVSTFSKILSKNFGLKEALCRFCNWKKITIKDFMDLLAFMKRRFVKGKDKIKFPSKANIVIQDDYLYQLLDVSRQVESLG